jgi:hypothetical protein
MFKSKDCKQGLCIFGLAYCSFRKKKGRKSSGPEWGFVYGNYDKTGLRRRKFGRFLSASWVNVMRLSYLSLE